MPIHPRSLLARDRARRNPRTLAAPAFQPAATMPTAKDIAPLLAELFDLMGKPTDGLVPETIVEWLNAQIGAVQSQSANPDDVGAAGLSLALSGTVDAGRVRIARDIARRRGISLESALALVPK